MPRLILVVDDDPLTLQTINEMLLENSRGVFEVVNANNGILGLEIADKLRPDVIITDWEMPRMDGIEFIKKIKASEKTREIPVIMASGIMLTSKDLEIALDAGAVDYIRKPIDRVELQARVRSALEIADQIKRLRKKQELITAQKTAILQQNIDKLQSDLEFQHGELNSQLSYLMQKENDRQEIIQELNKLKPYLNQEGKLRLAQLSDRLNAQDHSHSVLELENRFDEVNHKFYQALEAAVPGITKTEKVLSAYTLMRLAPAEIVSVTGKNLNSVNVAFSRLRAKLKVASNSELKDVLQNLAGKGNP